MKKHQNNIYVTGDTHGDPTRLKKIKGIRKGDFLIVCGDFGFIWDGSKKEKRRLKRLGKKKYHLLFVDGAHENFAELCAYPEEEWNGGMTRKISGNLRYLTRGEIFTLADKTLLAFGGGRLDGDEALSERMAQSDEETLPEIPRESEYRRGLAAITRHGGRVDYIISHEAPCKIADFIDLPSSKPNKSRANGYLDILGDSVEFERWFFGNHHINKVITSKYCALFDRVMRADEPVKSK